MNILKKLNIFRVFSYLKVSHKVWLSTATLLLVLAVVALSAITSLQIAQSRFSSVVEESQPLALASLELSKELNRANASLGFYLLSKADEDRQQFEQAMQQIDALLSQLNNMEILARDEQNRALVEKIGKDIETYKSYREQMLELAVDFSKNQPGISISALNMNPLALEIQQNLAALISYEANEKASKKRRKLFFELTKLRQNWMNLVIATRAYMAFRSESQLANIKLYHDGFKSQLGKVEAYTESLTFEQTDALEQVKTLQQEWAGHMTGMLEIHGSEKWRTDAYLIRTEIGPLVQRIGDDINSLVKQQKDLAVDTSRAVLSQVSSTRNVLITLLIVGSILGVLAAGFMSMMITVPLKETLYALEDIAEGEGDLTRRIKVKGKDEVAALSRGFNLFFIKIHTAISEVSDATEQLAAAAEEMSNITEQNSRGIQKQKAETESVASSMTEMASTAQEMAKHAERAAASTSEVDKHAVQGKDIVANTRQIISQLATEVERVSDVIKNLEGQGEKISTIAEVIRDIAEQTNLLALNAAIEAARAGEQGRGFAVVADEVRNLASRTQQSTKEIEDMIQGLQSGTREAAEAMEQGRARAHDSVEQANLAENTLNEITMAVHDVMSMNTQIAKAAAQQGSVSEEISRNINTITEVADSTNEGMEQMAKASLDLAKLAADLKAQMDQFIV